MERLMLQLLARWTRLQELMVWQLFADAGPDAQATFRRFPPDDDLLRDYKRYAKRNDVSWPKDQFSAAYRTIREHRNSIGHLMAVVSIEGNEPNRTITFQRSGDIEWIDEKWSRRQATTVVLTERELLIDIAELIEMARRVLIIPSIIDRIKHGDPDHEISIEWIKWWDRRWVWPHMRTPAEVRSAATACPLSTVTGCPKTSGVLNPSVTRTSY